jgi:hypothetical protein
VPYLLALHADWSIVVLCTLGLPLGIIAYYAALAPAMNYAELIKAAFDLYRRALLESLSLQMPSTLTEERQLWKKLCAFFAHGLTPDEDVEPVTFQKPSETKQEPQTFLSTITTRLKAADRQLEQIYELDLKQARRWSRISIMSASLGILIIIGGVITIFTGNTIAGLVISVAGSISEITAVLTLQQAKKAYKQVDSSSEKLLQAETIKQALSSGNAALKEEIIAQVLSQAAREHEISTTK